MTNAVPAGGGRFAAARRTVVLAGRGAVAGTVAPYVMSDGQVDLEIGDAAITAVDQELQHLEDRVSGRSRSGSPP